jgi:hypothetical protein
MHAPISFDLKSFFPFLIKHSNKSENERYTLNAKTKRTFQVEFLLSSQIAEPDRLTSFDPQTNCGRIESELIIEYSAVFQQRIPISARIYKPCLNIDRREVNFGTCLVGQERCEQIILKNNSMSKLSWTLRIGTLQFHIYSSFFLFYIYFCFLFLFSFLENDESIVFRADSYAQTLEPNKLKKQSCENIVNIYFKAR